MMHKVILGALLVTAMARVASAQDTTALIASDRAANAELSKIIDGARANGLPVEPILAKVNYGVLMKAPAARIIAAVRGTAARLEEARAALAPNPTNADIAAGENALSSNVSVKSLKEIRGIAKNRPMAVPLGLLSQLVVSGVEEPKATKIVASLIRNGASVQQLAEVGNDFSSLVLGGLKPDNAIDLRANRLYAVLGVPTGSASAAGDQHSLQAGPSSPTPPGKKKP